VNNEFGTGTLTKKSDRKCSSFKDAELINTKQRGKYGMVKKINKIILYFLFSSKSYLPFLKT
jgi:hypothetical protein